MVELLLLLLPIAAGYGWYMGQRSLRQSQEEQQQKLRKSYFTGLNYLLSNKSDKAIDYFIEMLDVDDESIDTHLSLGTLFRQKGEVDKAIRLHTGLLSSELCFSNQQLVLLELGRDYLEAGFYDKAESTFLDLLKEDPKQKDVVYYLLKIYENTKEWNKGIDILGNLDKDSKKSLKVIIANFYCEQASLSDNSSVQRKLLRAALDVYPQCGRAILMLFKSNYTDKKIGVKCLNLLLDVDVELFDEVLDLVKEMYADDKLGYESILKKALNKGAGVNSMIALTDYLQSDHVDEPLIEDIIVKQLSFSPSAQGFLHLLQLHLAKAESVKEKSSLELLIRLVKEQIDKRSIYTCTNCGYETNIRYWHCPSCKKWGTIKTIRGINEQKI